MHDRVKAAAGALLLTLGVANFQASLNADDRPAPEDIETAWSAWIADQWNGTAEYRLPDGSRVDVLTPSLAVEVEWPSKWAEAVGQAAFYRASTNRAGAVCLLMGRNPLKQELPYYQRCLVACVDCELLIVVVDVREGKAMPPEPPGNALALDHGV